MSSELNVNPDRPDPNPAIVNNPGSSSAATVAQSHLALKLQGDGDLQSYVSLRESLDWFKAMAIAYFSGGPDAKQREQRAKDVRDAITNFKTSLKGQAAQGCPAGFHQAPDGTCVPNGTGDGE